MFALNLLRVDFAHRVSGGRQMAVVDASGVRVEAVEVGTKTSGTAPIFRSRRDKDITSGIYARLPVLVDRTSGDGIAVWPMPVSLQDIRRTACFGGGSAPAYPTRSRAGPFTFSHSTAASRCGVSRRTCAQKRALWFSSFRWATSCATT